MPDEMIDTRIPRVDAVRKPATGRPFVLRKEGYSMDGFLHCPECGSYLPGTRSDIMAHLTSHEAPAEETYEEPVITAAAPESQELDIVDVLSALEEALTAASAPPDVMASLGVISTWAGTGSATPASVAAAAASGALTASAHSDPNHWSYGTALSAGASPWRSADPTPFSTDTDLSTPPPDWFSDPRLTGPTPLTVDDSGRVFGHAALWDSCHIGHSGRCLTPPHSRANYSYFHTGAVRAGGEMVAKELPVGTITLDTGHADLSLAAKGAASHYDDTGTAVADVTVGEDRHGIWVSGSLRPGVTREAVRTLRASALSGDWRKIENNLELVALLAVNVPGFPIPRSMAASGEMVPLSLVAAGAYDPVPGYDDDGEMVSLVAAGMVTPVEARIAQLEMVVRHLAPLAPELEQLGLAVLVSQVTPSAEEADAEMDSLMASIGLVEEETVEEEPMVEEWVVADEPAGDGDATG